MIPKQYMPSIFDLNNKVALVTGGGRGVGKSIALGLAGFGANIAICVRENLDQAEQVCDIIRTMGRQSLSLGADASSLVDMDQVIAETSKQLGSISILINNVGGGSRLSSLETSEDEWKRVVFNNMKSTFFFSTKVARGMIDNKIGGTIINVASIAGMRSLLGRSVYSMAKSGVIQLTRSMAVEWAEQGIRVNAIAPGYLDTQATRPLFKPGSDYYNWIIAKTPQKRILSPDELVGAVVLLASEASSAITGQVICIDGGWTAL